VRFAKICDCKKLTERASGHDLGTDRGLKDEPNEWEESSTQCANHDYRTCKLPSINSSNSFIGGHFQTFRPENVRQLASFNYLLPISPQFKHLVL
jgi:hypothetical protein